jgi:hypothetical protein
VGKPSWKTCAAIARSRRRRQTASFRPDQSWSLLEQAERWDGLAVAEFETYFNVRKIDDYDRRPYAASYADRNWAALAAAA